MFFLFLFSIPHYVSHYFQNQYVKKYLPVILLYYLVAFYVYAEYESLLIQDYTQWDFFYVFPYLDSCDVFTLPQERAVVKFYQFCLSQELFGNPKIISFAESVGILIVSFFLANKISKTHYAGLIAVTIIISSKIFTDNTTTFGYSTEWAFFFIASVYLIYKIPVLSGPVYLLSILSKGITLLYLPVVFYVIYKSNISSAAKKTSYLSLGIMAATVIIYTLFVGNHFVQTNIPVGFHIEKLDDLLYSTYYNFTGEAEDPFVLYLLVPLLLIGLYKHREFLLLVAYLFTMQVWLPLFSDYNMGSYRMVPLVLFGGICAGITISHHLGLGNDNGKRAKNPNDQQYRI